MSERDMVKQFHEAMGLPVRRLPEMPSEAERLMRARLIHEEAGEVIRALGCVVLRWSDGSTTVESRPDLVGEPVLSNIAHELADLQYVTHGGQVEAGVPQDVFAEVHRANMSKLGDDGRPVLRADGKVMKGPKYRPPDVARVLRECEK